jgi:hypothetical protein
MMSVGEKLAKVNDNFNVYMYDNGFMLEIGGRDHSDDWCTAKILCNSLEELTELIKEATGLPRD